MTIGEIITIDDKTRKVIGYVSGNCMIHGDKADLTRICRDATPNNLTDIPDIYFENYLPHIFKFTCPNGFSTGEVIEMYRLQIDSIKREADNQLYGSVDIGNFSCAVPFLNSNPHHYDSGGREWPLWQENELSGHRIPLVNGSGKSLLEEVCFGEARWWEKKMWGEWLFFSDDMCKRGYEKYAEIEKDAAKIVVGISREQFRELVKPIEEQLMNMLGNLKK